MITKQQKIDAIYNKIANKEMSLGCKFKIENFEICYQFEHDVFETEGELLCTYIDESDSGIIKFKVIHAIPYDKELGDLNIDHEAIENEYAFDASWEQLEVIGHPVMIGDIFDYLENLKEIELIKILIKADTKMIFDKWKNKRLTLEEQSEQCISFIYNLISE